MNVFASQSSGIVPYAVAGKTSSQVVAVYKGQRSAAAPGPGGDSVPGLFSSISAVPGRGQSTIRTAP